MHKVKEIDSIARINRVSIQPCGLIKKSRFLFGKKIIGGFSKDIYLDTAISPDTNNRHIIKATYNETLFITKNHVEYLKADFYYYEDTLFFVRIRKLTDKKNTQSVSLIDEIDMTKTIDPTISKKLSFDVTKWIAIYDTEFRKIASSVNM